MAGCGNGGGLPGGKAPEYPQITGNQKRKLFWASVRLRYGPTRGGQCRTSGRLQGLIPPPTGPGWLGLSLSTRAPKIPCRPPARPCRFRYPERYTHSSSAIFSPILRASETTEFGATGLAGPAAASGFRCGQGRGLVSQGDPLPRRLGGASVGRSAPAMRCSVLGTVPLIPVTGRERVGGKSG